MTYYRVCNQINTTVSLVQQELVTLTEHLRSPPVFSRVRITRSSLVLCVMFGRSLFVPFLLAIVLSVLLRFKDFDYPFSIIKFFLSHANVSSTLRDERESNISCDRFWLHNQIKIQISNKDTAKDLITMRGAVGGCTTFCKTGKKRFFQFIFEHFASQFMNLLELIITQLQNNHYFNTSEYSFDLKKGRN